MLTDVHVLPNGLASSLVGAAQILIRAIGQGPVTCAAVVLQVPQLAAPGAALSTVLCLGRALNGQPAEHLLGVPIQLRCKNRSATRWTRWPVKGAVTTKAHSMPRTTDTVQFSLEFCADGALEVV